MVYAYPYERQVDSVAGISWSLQLLDALAFMQIGSKHPGHAHRTTSGACRPEQPGSGWQSAHTESRNHCAPKGIRSHEKVLAVWDPGLCSRLHCFCRGRCAAEHVVCCDSMRCRARHKSQTLVAFGILRACVMSISWLLGPCGRAHVAVDMCSTRATAASLIRMIVMTSTSEGGCDYINF